MQLDELPVAEVLCELTTALKNYGRAILTAPPGSGKTTRVPLYLLEQATFPGTILVLEPRRLAARSAARYMSGLLGEETGQTVGYRVRMENRVSAQTRIEFLTEGILTRRLIADPELRGVSCIIFDEFHERSLQADLGLALALEAREALRPDLGIIVMSATLHVEPLQALLKDCPIIRAAGQSYPVQISHAPGQWAFSQHIPGMAEITQKVPQAILQTLEQEPGDILVFLPGTGEIRGVAQALPASIPGVCIHPLYGDLSSHEQDAAIAPSPPGQRKVVLATSIAETSLTIEGVRVVIDAGLSRSMRFDPATGLSRLITERVSQAGADQRAGRAGRTEPGACIRLWKEGEALIPFARPEIAEADLCSLLLDILAWGADAAELMWVTPPPPAALSLAAQTLLRLGAAKPVAVHSTTDSGNSIPRLAITPHGLEISQMPLHPRLGHMVLMAQTQPELAKIPGMASLAACLAAIVSDRDPLRRGQTPPHADIRMRLAALGNPAHKRMLDAARQIHRQSGAKDAFKLPPAQLEDFSGPLLSLAWPERIAQQRARGSFRMAAGQGASFSTGYGTSDDPLAESAFLAIATLGKGQGGDARIYLAAPLTLDDIRLLHGTRISQGEEIFWDDKSRAAVSRFATRLESLVLEESTLAAPDRQPDHKLLLKKAVLQGIANAGLTCLPWTDILRQWQARVALLRSLEPEGADHAENAESTPSTEACPHFSQLSQVSLSSLFPDVSDHALLEALKLPPDNPDNWLAPWLDNITRQSQFSSIDLQSALYALLPWPLPKRLEEEAPQKLAVPSGSEIYIDYLPESGPVLPVKLQEMFGQTTTPTIAGGRIPLTIHLLSPAGRPLQITSDLGYFWLHGYAAVRAEMRGRYPKHPWPEDPLTAPPTRKVKNRM